jgi:hypothetical protein
MQNKLRTNTTTIETMLNDIGPNLRQYLHKDILILDILPYMLEILQPRLRQVKLFFSHYRHYISTYLDQYCTFY